MGVSNVGKCMHRVKCLQESFNNEREFNLFKVRRGKKTFQMLQGNDLHNGYRLSFAKIFNYENRIIKKF